MSIELRLEPSDIDLVFLALQTAPLPTNYTQVKNLLDKISEQGLPQLAAMAVIKGDALPGGINEAA